MISPRGEQLALLVVDILVLDTAHDQPCSHRHVRSAVVERGVGGFGDLGIGDPLAGLLVIDRLRIPDRNPGLSGIEAIAARIVGLSSVVIEKRASARRHAPITAAE